MAALTIGTVMMLPLLGPRIHAGARRGQPLDSRHRPAQHFARAAHENSRVRLGPSWPPIPEVESIVNQLGRPDDATDTDGYYNSEYFVPLRPEKDWPKLVKDDRLVGLRSSSSARCAREPRTKSSTR